MYCRNIVLLVPSSPLPTVRSCPAATSHHSLTLCSLTKLVLPQRYSLKY